MAHFNLYRAQSNWKMQIIRVADSLVWDAVAGLLSANPNWADTVSTVGLFYKAAIGGYTVTIPSSLPAGEYDIKFYDTESPAVEDEVQKIYRVNWTDKHLLGNPQEI